MKKNLYVAILLDRSGSMEICRDPTIGAVNEYINSLKSEAEVEARVTLVQFDSHNPHEVVFEAQPIADVQPLTRETFVPRASTPLNDAIGKLVERVDKAELRANENVAVVIVTDGQENASQEFTAPACKALLAGRQKDKNWLVIYLGANQDAFAEGSRVGTQMANTMTFDAGNIDVAMKSASRATRAYGLTGSAAAASFTDDERARAVEKKKQQPVA